ncbi:cytochrome P450 [Mycena olivaceomarginata]|nr:cytochrome P450 [Mycena olivaceomarginata]
MPGIFIIVLPRNMEASSDLTACSGYNMLGSTYYFLSLGPQEKQLYVFNPKSLYQILVKDQDMFEEADSNLYGSLVLFSEGILATSGEQHKKKCKMLNPAFSAAHLRQMAKSHLLRCREKAQSFHSSLQSAIQSRVQDGPKENNILLWMTRTALELIGQAGLGHSFDSLDTDEIPPYITSVKKLQVTVHKMALGMKYILPWVTKLGTPNFRRLIVNIFPWQTLHEGRDTADTLYATAVRIYHLKKMVLVDEGGSFPIAGQGKDIASILLKANSNASSNERLSEDEIIGQASQVIFNHVRNVDISYDQLNSMEYLDAICRETLRLYPPVSFIRRMTQKDVALTTSTPITTLDGSTATEIPVPARTEVIVSILASNRNPAIWGSDVLEWKPERWLSPLPKSVTEAHLPGIYSHL